MIFTPSKFLLFKNSDAKSKDSSIWFLDNLINILFLSSKSHLFDEKKYKFLISWYESLDLSIILLKFKNSSIAGFPKIKGNWSS